MESIRQVIYVSRAVRPLDKDELEALVATASRNNQLMHITGGLLYIDKSFIQVLEGSVESISELLSTIEADPRHRDLRILSDRMVDFRNFDEWSMGYVKPTEKDSAIVIRELRSVPEQVADDMPLPNTFTMMRQLYKTDRALQRARSNA